MIYICTNAETIAQAVDHQDHEVCKAVAEMFLERGSEPSRIGGLADWMPESNFSAWHGGRMDRRFHAGLVAWDEATEATEAARIEREISESLKQLLALELS